MSTQVRRIVFGPWVEPGTFAILLRRGTREEWVAINPVLFDREPSIDMTNEEVRIGDGTTAWVDLPAASPQDALDLLLNARPGNEEVSG